MAIERCVAVNERVVPITGKAGTGKTAIIQAVYETLTKAGYLVQCTGPTGMAAKRIKEATGIDGMTNHRLLGYGMPFEQTITDDHSGAKETVRLSTGPRFNKKNHLPYDFILADEYAMVNQEIHRNLIDAMRVGARIRMFGDVNQLRPIEEDRRLQDAPSAFQNALTKFKGIELTTNHRTDKESGIAVNGERILAGRPPVQRSDFKLVYTQAPVITLQEVVRKALDRGIDFSSTEHQIITCMNVSWVGTIKLNAILQQLFWKREHDALDLPRWRSDNNKVRVQIGSKVIYTANTYDLNNGCSVFNGEVGTVVDINPYDGTVDVELADRIVSIPPHVVIENGKTKREFDPRCNLDLAYAITTHKMQGSECKHCIYIMNKSTIYGQSRRNFYTAISRARTHCTVIADSQSLTKSLKYAG